MKNALLILLTFIFLMTSMPGIAGIVNAATPYIKETFDSGTVGNGVFTTSNVSTGTCTTDGWSFAGNNYTTSRPTYQLKVAGQSDKVANIDMSNTLTYTTEVLRYAHVTNASDFNGKVYFSCDVQPVINTATNSSGYMRLCIGSLDNTTNTGSQIGFGIASNTIVIGTNGFSTTTTLNVQGDTFTSSTLNWLRFSMVVDNSVSPKTVTYTVKNLTNGKTYADNVAFDKAYAGATNIPMLSVTYRNKVTGTQYMNIDNLTYAPYDLAFPKVITQSSVSVMDKSNNILSYPGNVVHFKEPINPVNVNTIVDNPTVTDKPIKCIAAAYDSNNKLLSIKAYDTLLKANTSNQTVTVSGLDISKAQYVKLLYLNNFNSVTPYITATKMDIYPIQDITKNYITKKSVGDVTLNAINQFQNKAIPKPVYWYWKTTDPANPTKSLDGEDLFYTNAGTVPTTKYLDDLNKYIDTGAFDLFMPSNQANYRGYLDFYHFAQCTEWFKKSVDLAHSRGMKFGIQLFDPIGGTDKSKNQAFAQDFDALLDTNGQMNMMAATPVGAYTNTSCIDTELLKVYVFKKTADGFYDPATLQDVTQNAVITNKLNDKLNVSLNLGNNYNGFTAHIITAHYYQYGDVFNTESRYEYLRPLQVYHDAGIKFDAAALDEVGMMPLNVYYNSNYTKTTWRIYSDSFATFYQGKTGKSLVDDLFKMRYAPKGDDSEKIRAINQYYENIVLGPRMVEAEFYDKAKELFGSDCYVGVHNTRHNQILSDDIYRTGNQFWQIKRDFAFTDEGIEMPVRLGIAATKPNSICYDMYYCKDVNQYYNKVITDLPYNSRVFNLALNDRLHGFDFEATDNGKFMAKMALIGRRIGLLDEFAAPLPKTDLLFVYGSPALSNWYPNTANQNKMNLNSLVTAQEVDARASFAAGYVSALIPSSEIDEGKVSVNADGTIKYGNITYKALFYVQPEYSKQSTVNFLKELEQRGGKFLINGNITKDFYGKPIDDNFKALVTAKQSGGSANTALVLDKLSTVLGIEKNNIPNGCTMADGSVQISDVASMFSDQSAEFKIIIGQYTYTGTYNGVVALKANVSTGEIEKLACGGFTSIKVNGVEAFAIKDKADILMVKQLDGKYKLTISESKCEHLIP